MLLKYKTTYFNLNTFKLLLNICSINLLNFTQIGTHDGVQIIVSRVRESNKYIINNDSLNFRFSQSAGPSVA